MVIDSLQKHDGTSVSLANVNILVGPNNVGKTQTLQDIRSIMTQPQRNQGLIFESIDFSPFDSFEQLTQTLSVREDTQHSRYIVSGTDRNATVPFNAWDRWKASFSSSETDNAMNQIAPAKFSFLDAASRLQIGSSQEIEGERQNPQSTIESLFYGPRENLEILREIFVRTFEEDIVLDYSEGGTLRFRISDNFHNIPEHPMDLGEYLDSIDAEKLDDQGDGFLSFVGVITSILVSEGRLILLDEPAAFLHPPQARILGNWIADRAESTPGQIVIATHNSDFLFGILEEASEVNIFRLNRPDRSTIFRSVPPRITKKLAEDHLLSSQRVLRSVFHEGVVVCEGGKDRVVYQSAASNIGDQTDLLFIDALGWKIIKRVTRSLNGAEIPVAAIADLDVLSERDEFKKLLLSLRTELAYDDIENTIQARDAVAQEVSENGNWDDIKVEGIQAFPADVQEEAASIVEAVEQYGLFLVHVGVLESWMNLEHINEPWPVAALEVIDDNDEEIIDNIAYEENILDFISEVCSYTQEEYSRVIE